MPRAKAFFFVCAGIFLLALSYQLGASRAIAQSNSWRPVGNNLVVSGNGVFWGTLASGWQAVSGLPVPGSQVAAAWAPSTGPPEFVLTTSGEGWVWRDSAGWQSIGLVPGVTPATQETWGQLKARYR